MKKRTFSNPFKLWLPWIGGIIAVFIILNIKNGGGPIGIVIMLPPLIDPLVIFDPEYLELLFRFIFLPFTIGFLMGWGIHSLFRRLRR